MNLHRSFLTAAIAAALAATVTFAPANAAVQPGRRAAGPDTTMKIPCRSPRVWLRVVAAAGKSCYTGTGSLPISLHGVTEVQIVGKHRACLTVPAGTAASRDRGRPDLTRRPT
jgi:hypothetical protein